MANMVRIKQAECLVALRRLDDAREILKGCADSLGVTSTKALIAETAGENDQALELAKKVLEKLPQDRSAGLIAGRIWTVQRDWDSALPLLQRLTEAHPFDHEPRLLWGRALIGSGDKPRGEAEIQRATEIKDAFLKFADLHQEAIRRPLDANLRLELGRLAESLGKLDLARQWYRAAVGLDEQNAQALAALQRLSQPPSGR
jgi:tetratricopeptide (TPR) repeat protein